jgi:DNA-binding transcriptional MerR regulator
MTERGPLPPKLYFRIGEVAGLVGVEPHVLRYWEREFRSIRPTKRAKGQRVYSRRDVENLMRVRDLLYADGFTIAGAKKKLQRSGTEPEDRAVAQGVAPSTPEPEPTPIAAPPPPDTARGLSDGIHVRTALRELRSEIEALLAELGG